MGSVNGVVFIATLAMAGSPDAVFSIASLTILYISTFFLPVLVYPLAVLGVPRTHRSTCLHTPIGQELQKGVPSFLFKPCLVQDVNFKVQWTPEPANNFTYRFLDGGNHVQQVVTASYLNGRPSKHGQNSITGNCTPNDSTRWTSSSVPRLWVISTRIQLAYLFFVPVVLSECNEFEYDGCQNPGFRYLLVAEVKTLVGWLASLSVFLRHVRYLSQGSRGDSVHGPAYLPLAMPQFAWKQTENLWRRCTGTTTIVVP